MTPSGHVRLQVLVREKARNARGIADVEAALRALGFEVTGSGKASVSARATPEAFTAVFGDAPAPSSFHGAQASPGLPVPPPLAATVESISVAPRHTFITRSRIRDRRGGA